MARDSLVDSLVERQLKFTLHQTSIPLPLTLTSDVTMSAMSRGLSHHIVLHTDICIGDGETLDRNSGGLVITASSTGEVACVVYIFR